MSGQQVDYEYRLALASAVDCAEAIRSMFEELQEWAQRVERDLVQVCREIGKR